MRKMKKTKIKLGIIVLTCITFMPLLITSANAGIIPGGPDPVPREYYAAKCHLFISKDSGANKFYISYYLTAVVVDGVRLADYFGICYDHDLITDGYSIELLEFYREYFYTGGSLTIFEMFWVYRVNKYEDGVIKYYFDFTYSGYINNAGEIIFDTTFSNDGSEDLGNWNFKPHIVQGCPKAYLYLLEKMIGSTW